MGFGGASLSGAPMLLFINHFWETKRKRKLNLTFGVKQMSNSLTKLTTVSTVV